MCGVAVCVCFVCAVCAVCVLCVLCVPVCACVAFYVSMLQGSVCSSRTLAFCHGHAVGSNICCSACARCSRGRGASCEQGTVPATRIADERRAGVLPRMVTRALVVGLSEHVLVSYLCEQLDIIHFISTPLFNDKDAVCVALAGACDEHHEVVSRAEDLLRRLNKVDVDDNAFVQRLFRMCIGSPTGTRTQHGH